MYDVAESCSISPSKRGLLRMWVTIGGGIPPAPLLLQPARLSSAQTTPITTPTRWSFTRKAVRCPLGVPAGFRGISKALALSIGLPPHGGLTATAAIGEATRCPTRIAVSLSDYLTWGRN